MGHFMVRTQQGSILYVYAKFEADISIRSEVIRGPKISTLGHVTQATPNYGWIYGLDAVGVRSLCPCQFWVIYLHSFNSYKGGPKMSKFQ